ncbi:hypothetical protein MPSEU_000145000 [Mayamaea pseudoterrestris]|nr:hypothetical protein MPSEU_000145000 [Mayamaea pseudoterrestris]
MSKWLQNAANFLEKLDDTAAKVIVEQRGGSHDDDDDGLLDSILASRGLDEEMNDQELQDQLSNAWSEHDDLDLSMKNVDASEAMAEQENSEGSNDPVEENQQNETPAKAKLSEGVTSMQSSDTPFRTPRQLSSDSLPSDNEAGSGDEAQQNATNESDEDQPSSSVRDEQVDAPNSSVEAPSTAVAPSSRPVSPIAPGSHAGTQQLLQSQKELRTLKRHILALHQQLESSEREVKAQRHELESAGALMEKERLKFKTEKDKLTEKHQSDTKTLKQAHSDETKLLHSQIKTLNEQRAQEGGNWTKELEDALVREQETLRKVALLQDEKETLQQHIDTLEQQQQALGSRLESLTETADAAMDRERQAETRLDELLTAHARQIQQRQLREAELEKTVSELGAALVKSSENAGSDRALMQPTYSHDMQIIESLRAEMETIQTQLEQEQQRNKILQDELRNVSSEQSDEATVLQLRREQHDRQIQQLNETILELKRELQREKEHATSNRLNGDDETMKQVRNLSEDVIRLRDKLSSSSSEISALKSRLHVALDRAKRAEQALEERLTAVSGFGDIEVGSGATRQRGGLKGHPTMRAALKLDVVQGEGSERFAKSLDSLDKFLVQSGRFLRQNAVARLLFILYFVTMHLWTFVLLFFHVHGYDTMRTDFATSGHGPAGMIAQQAAQVAQRNASDMMQP